MLIRVIIGVLIVLGGDAAAAHGAAGGDRSADFDPKATLPHFQVRDETTRDVLFRLGDAQGFFVCIEDPKGGSGSSPRRFSMEFRDRSIESIVEAILDRDGGYSWTMDGDVLNVVSRELTAGNPFESTIEGFRFKGTTDEFLQKASSLVAGLSVSRVRYYLPEEPVFQLELDGPMLLREAFNAFTRASRMRWHATVPEGPETLTIQGGGTSREHTGILRVDVQFANSHPISPTR